MHKDGREILVIADSPDVFTPVAGAGWVGYRPRVKLPKGWTLEESVASFTWRPFRIPSRVVLKDYNYRRPDADLRIATVEGPDEPALFYEYGDHYPDVGEGRRLSRIRTEEIRCRERVFNGKSDVRSFRSGGTFELREHYRPEFNRRCVSTKIEHAGEVTDRLPPASPPPQARPADDRRPDLNP